MSARRTSVMLCQVVTIRSIPPVATMEMPAHPRTHAPREPVRGAPLSVMMGIPAPLTAVKACLAVHLFPTSAPVTMEAYAQRETHASTGNALQETPFFAMTATPVPQTTATRRKGVSAFQTRMNAVMGMPARKTIAVLTVDAQRAHPWSARRILFVKLSPASPL